MRQLIGAVCACAILAGALAFLGWGFWVEYGWRGPVGVALVLLVMCGAIWGLSE